jgi:hypothetical protein
MRAYKKGATLRDESAPMSEDAKRLLFGQTAASTAR